MFGMSLLPSFALPMKAAVLPKDWKQFTGPHCGYPQDSTLHEAYCHIAYIYNHANLSVISVIIFILLLWRTFYPVRILRKVCNR